MKCKLCGKNMKSTKGGLSSSGWSLLYCNCSTGTSFHHDIDNNESEVRLSGVEVDNLIKMRDEHAEQKDRIEELEKENNLLRFQNMEHLEAGFILKQQLADLTPPFKIGQKVWAYNILGDLVYAFCEGCYKNKLDEWNIILNCKEEIQTVEYLNCCGEVRIFTDEAEARANRKIK